jgi:hypothetical protein
VPPENININSVYCVAKLLLAIKIVFFPVDFCTQNVDVSFAIMPPAIDTVKSRKTAERKTTIRTVADLRLNRLRVAIRMVKAVRESGFRGAPLPNP